jgi:CDP-glucose 4,6-dehydratase
MESIGMSRSFWAGKRVFITGHTGFKGGWLALWLADMQAEVHGYALAPLTKPNFFTLCNIEKCVASSSLGDIRDAGALSLALKQAQPEIVLHLAAQPLVRYSYESPVETYEVNVMGTVNLLEAVRNTKSVKAVVNVTTDKCYENREWVWPYREDEAMGGHDPYSNSKGCSELVTMAYRKSFLAPADIHVATARAGNVIGGGDWALDRLIPDFFRAVDGQKNLIIRSPDAIRPWQHVLEPLSGYLILAERLFLKGEAYTGAWNFGPEKSDARSVRWIVDRLCEKVVGSAWQLEKGSQPHEANTLKLDSSKARSFLGWRPRWNLETALDKTLEWYRAGESEAIPADMSLKQIADYEGQ